MKDCLANVLTLSNMREDSVILISHGKEMKRWCDTQLSCTMSHALKLENREKSPFSKHVKLLLFLDYFVIDTQDPFHPFTPRLPFSVEKNE